MAEPANGATNGVAAPAMVVIQTATLEDAPRLGRVISDANADLEKDLWLVPDAEERPYVLPAYYALRLEVFIEHGVVHTTRDHRAVAAWLPINRAVPTIPDYSARLVRIAGRWTDRFRTFESTIDSHHPLYHPHHWLAFLAVTPNLQRHGVGTQLMDHHHRALDELNSPGYLQAADWSSYDFYKARGWQEHATPFLIARDGPPTCPMWRNPRPPNGYQP